MVKIQGYRSIRSNFKSLPFKSPKGSLSKILSE